MTNRGWILDLYPKPGQMIVWLKRPDGSCVRLVDGWKPRIRIGGEVNDLLNLQPFIPACAFVEKFARAGDKARSKVLEVEVDSEFEAQTLARQIVRYGGYSRYRLYDADIPSTQMYLYCNDLFPLAFVEANDTLGHIEWVVKDSRERLDYELPLLRILRLKVTTKKTRRIPTFKDELGSLTLQTDNEIITINSGSEPDKLTQLVDAFRTINPDVVLTEGGDSFIFPYLARRAKHHHILHEMILGREETPLRVYEVQGHSYFSYGKILFKQTAARLPGRLHVDEANGFISSDCGLEGLFEVARTCIIPLQRASRTTIGTSMTSLQLYHAVKADVLIPWNKNEPEEWKNGNELILADRGGFIYEPQFGLHESVGELDFSSLYPTIMCKMNLSGETVHCACCPNSIHRVPELGWNICERWEGIVPRSLDILLRKRLQYKKLKKENSNPDARRRYDQRQAALKWILVCCLEHDEIVPTLIDGQLRISKIGELIDAIVGDCDGIYDCNEDIQVVGLDRDFRIKYVRVRRLLKTQAPEKMLNIVMENGRRICTTCDHEFYVLNRGRLCARRADKLKLGDLIPVAKNLPAAPEEVREIDVMKILLAKLDPSEIEGWRLKGKCLKPAIRQKSKLFYRMGLPYANVHSWHRNGMIPLRYFHHLDLAPELSRELLVGKGRIKGGRTAWIPSVIPINPDLGFFLGLFIADGSAGSNFLRFDIGQSEPELLEYLRNTVWKLFRLRIRISKEKRARMYIAQINCVTLVRVLEKVLGVGRTTDRGKLTVPACIWNAPSDAILGFISGLIAGDGSAHKTRNIMSIATASKSFQENLSYLLLRVRFQHSLQKSCRLPSNLYRLDMVDPPGFTKLKQVGFLKKTHAKRLSEMIAKTCTQECHHITYELIPVVHSNMRTLAKRLRTVRDPRVDIHTRICPERALRMLQKLQTRNAHRRYTSAYRSLERVCMAHIGFVAVKEIQEMRSSSNFVYCFELEGPLPGFFAGTGAVFTHNSFGYLGFKNARFGRIDAHIATCAFSRQILRKAVAIAESRGFKRIHGIVDSMWLKKPDATPAEYENLCREIEAQLHFPIEFEGLYKWIVFLNSRTDPRIPVLNRYYGVFQDGKLKLRGIDLRKHDTPGIVRRCQTDMLTLFAQAGNSEEFKALIPQALTIVKSYVNLIRGGAVPVEELTIEKRLSKNPNEYRNMVPQAIAARHLVGEGMEIHAGQTIAYVLTCDRSRITQNRALPTQLISEGSTFDSELYVDLLVSSTANLLLPFEYDQVALKERFRASLAQKQLKGSLPAINAQE